LDVDIGPERSLIVENVSSMMMRRSDLAEIGYWHEVRFAADTELRSRIAMKHGYVPDRVHPTVPLSFLLTSDQSLSGHWVTGLASMRYGARSQYRSLYMHWHKQESQQGSPNWRVERGEHRFPVAESQLKKNAETRAPFIVVSDFADEQNSVLNKAVVSQLSSVAGCAFCHWPRPSSTQAHMCGEIINLLHDQRMRPVMPGDVARCDILIVADPEILSAIPESLPRIERGRVLIVEPTPGYNEHAGRKLLDTVSSIFEIRHDAQFVSRSIIDGTELAIRRYLGSLP
jgi:hypothetical protein